MVKTLRITSIIAAVLATFLIVFPAVFGVGRDKQVEEFLKSDGAVERFKKAAGAKTGKDSGSQTSPLVSQAEAFALYLNPPKPVHESQPVPAAVPSIIPRPMGPVSPKFKLIGTSYYVTHPELSLALIDEAGTGLRWVRQSGEVGHLVIEQIKDGLVVLRDGETTSEMAVSDRPVTISLLKGASTEGAVSTAALPDSGQPTSLPEVTIGSLPQLDPERSKALDELVDQLKALQSSMEPGQGGSEDRDAKTAAIDKVISEFKTSRVTNEEAKKLDDLGKSLKGTQRSTRRGTRRPRLRNDANSKTGQEPNQPEGDKLDASPPETNSPEN
jgi:hypothetical protein